MASSSSGILVDGRRICPTIINNEVSAKERLPLDYAWHSCMYSRTLLGFILEVIIERKCPTHA